MLGRRSVTRLLVLVAATAVLTIAFASSALAAPTVPWLGLDGLRSALDATPTHHLTGHMSTVVEGADIIDIPVTVLAVPKTGSAENSLIMFEATGTLIAKYGGIVAGMSGSPIYLDDGRLIGAVSYGEEFTLGGTGLATPIEAMSRIETLYNSVEPLAAPVITSNGLYNQIIVAPNPEAYKGAAAAGAFVAKPLSTLFIGGMKPSSKGYKVLEKDFSSRGLGTVTKTAPLVGGGGDETAFATTLTAGSSVAVAAVRGTAWWGGVGTVTYVNGENVLAFGHSAWWSGATSLYMGNAWIEGIWPSADEPSKIADFGKIRGTITEDRYSGVMGKSNKFPLETTIAATAICTDPDAAVVTTTSAVYMPRQLLANGFMDYDMATSAAYLAAANLFDQGSTPGSAHTTTTVDVADNKGHTYQIVMTNYTDSTYDIAWDSASDVGNAISKLQSVLRWGNETPQITSITLEGSYSTQREAATIVGINAPNGLQIGANHISVDVLAFGVEDTQTIPATLTIPAGTALGGTLIASEQESYDSELSDMLDSLGISVSVDSSGGRQTIAQIADGLNHSKPNNTIVVTFQPSLSGIDLPEGTSSSQLPSTDPITLNVAADWPINGEADVSVATISADAMPNPVAYGDWPFIEGTVNGPSKVDTVTLYATPAGSSVESTVAITKATSVDGEVGFEFDELDQIFTNTRYRIHVDATTGFTGADGYVTVYVKAPTSLSASATRIKRGRTVKLTANVYPKTAAGGTVVFERLSGKRWIKLATKTLAVSGSYAKATYTWKPGKGTQKARFRYLGGAYNAANTSGTRTVVVK